MLIEAGRLSLGSIAGVIVGAITGHYLLKFFEDGFSRATHYCPSSKEKTPKAQTPVICPKQEQNPAD